MERDDRRRVPGICFLSKATLNINVRLGASLQNILKVSSINLLYSLNQISKFSSTPMLWYSAYIFLLTEKIEWDLFGSSALHKVI